MAIEGGTYLQTFLKYLDAKNYLLNTDCSDDLSNILFVASKKFSSAHNTEQPSKIITGASKSFGFCGGVSYRTQRRAKDLNNPNTY